jgi:hypothetical protein
MTLRIPFSLTFSSSCHVHLPTSFVHNIRRFGIRTLSSRVRICLGHHGVFPWLLTMLFGLCSFECLGKAVFRACFGNAVHVCCLSVVCFRGGEFIDFVPYDAAGQIPTIALLRLNSSQPNKCLPLFSALFLGASGVEDLVAIRLHTPRV